MSGLAATIQKQEKELPGNEKLKQAESLFILKYRSQTESIPGTQKGYRQRLTALSG